MRRIFLPVVFLVALSLLRAAEPQLPDIAQIISAVAEAYRVAPEPIPATVVDVGILKYVPYSSFRVGPDRELNIYGDPESPTCVELGLYRELRDSEAERRKCLSLLDRLVPEVRVSSLSLTGGKMVKSGVVGEVTPPDAPDAYGGWWVSVYSLSRLRGEAGSAQSIAAIVVPKNAAPERLTSAGWTSSDVTRSRSYSGTSGGQVYVKGYHREGRDVCQGAYEEAVTSAKCFA